MPLVHIVLVRVPPGVDSSEFVETANDFCASISSVTSYKVGHATNGPAKNRGFNFAMVIELEDEDGLAQLHWAMRQAEADGQFVIPGASNLIINDFHY